MMNLLYSNGSALHALISQVFAEELESYEDWQELRAVLKAKTGLLILDADYGAQSGFALCEEVKLDFPKAWRVHLISNENSEGEAEKARYAGVDRLFQLPDDITELLQDG